MNEMQRRRARIALAMAALCVAGYSSVRAADNTYSWTGPGPSGNTSWSLNNASFTPPSNWILNGVNAAPPLVPALGDTTNFVFGGSYSVGTSTQNTTGSSTNPADYTINGITFNDYTTTSGGSLVLTTTGAGSRIINLGAGGIFMNTTAASTAGGSVSLQNASTATDNRLELTADQTWTVNNPTANLIIKRPVEGAFTITKTGVGSLQFSAGSSTITVGGTQQTITGNQTFAGTINLQQGGIRLDTVGTEMASPTMSLVVNTANDATLSATTAGIDQTINGNVFLGGAGSFLLAGSSSVIFNGTVNLLTDKFISQGGTAPSFRAVLFNGPIIGSGGLTKVGAGSMIFNGTNSYAGNTTIQNGFISISDFSQLGTATTPVTFGSNGTLTPSAGALVVRAANQSTNRSLVLNAGGASLDYQGSLTVNGTITSAVPASGGLFKVGAGTLTTGSIRIGGALNIPSGTYVTKPDGSDAASNHVGAVALGGGSGAWTSTLDLNNNNLVIDYTGAANSPLTTVANQIQSSYAGGTWKGTGITSSAAATVAANVGDTHKTALGFGEALALGIGTFSGQAVDSDAVLVRYTLAGDANLDGIVNASDFAALAANYGSTSSTWIAGDFNYDGKVNVTDFNALAGNFNASLPSSSVGLGTLVPEPAVGMAVILLAGALRKRAPRITK